MAKGNKKAAQKERASAKRKKEAAQTVLRTGKIKDKKTGKMVTANAAQRAAAVKRRDTHISTMKSQEKIIKSAKKERDNNGKTGNGDKGPFFFGTNIPLSSVKDSGKRDEINARLKTDIAAGDWEGANDALFSAAFNTVKGGKGQGNPNVSKVHSGEWKINKSPVSWAETAINSPNDVYKQKDGSVVSWDDKAGVLKDGVSTGSWGGQGTGENNLRSGQAPPKAGVKGTAPIDPVISGTTRKGGLSDLSTIFGAGTTGGTGGAGTGGGGFDPNALSQYGGGYNQFSESVYPYAIPARDFIWQTDPTEQGLLAEAMGRPDIAKMMLTGQYGPLAGQKYQYYGGRTGVNYGPTGGYGAGGVPLGQGGVPGLPGAGGNIGTGAGAGAGAGAGTGIPAAGGGGGLSLGGLGGLSLGGLGRPTMGGGRVQGGNVQSVADIRDQERASGIDQFAVNQMALPSILSGRAALPSASWTAPANPYQNPQGFASPGYVAPPSQALTDFRNTLASQPAGTGPANYASDFATLPPPPVGRVDPNIALNAANAAAHVRSQAAAAQAASQAMAASAANPFDFGSANQIITAQGGPPR